jgi:hypothetical protein
MGTTSPSPDLCTPFAPHGKAPDRVVHPRCGIRFRDPGIGGRLDDVQQQIIIS